VPRDGSAAEAESLVFWAASRAGAWVEDAVDEDAEGVEDEHDNVDEEGDGEADTGEEEDKEEKVDEVKGGTMVAVAVGIPLS